VIHVVRCFDDENVVHVDGSPDPLRDIETIEFELGMADIDTVQKKLDRVSKTAKSGDKVARAEVDFFQALVGHLSSDRPARTFDVPPALETAFKECCLLTAKPILFVANVDETSLQSGNAYSETLERYAIERGSRVVKICGQSEAELSELEDDEKLHFLQDLGVEEPGLHRLIRAAYSLLGLQTFFTAGEIEVRAWTIREGALAPKAAGEIHSDFENNFIRAEVIAYDEYIAVGGETGAKSKGVMRLEGKEYVVQDGDVVHFRVGV